MTLYLIETVVGIFAVDDELSIHGEQVHSKDPKVTAKIMKRLSEGNVSTLKHLFSELPEDMEIVSSNRGLVDAVEDERVGYGEFTQVSNEFKVGLPSIAHERGLISEPGEFFEYNHFVSKQYTHTLVHEALSNREVLLIPAVQLLGELDTTLNSLSGRMREWYGVHFPEMGRRVRDHEDYARIITKLGERENITTDELMKLTLKKKDAERIELAAGDSMGADLDDYDLKLNQEFAQKTLDIYKFREELSEYIATVTREIAPNISILAGPVLAAKLLDKAGGLKRLALMPASTIQVLGAEKAMFRAKKTNARPPKHGLLYQHPYVNSASRDKRGRRARSLAAKIAIGARADLFSGNMIAEDLASQLEDF